MPSDCSEVHGRRAHPMLVDQHAAEVACVCEGEGRECVGDEDECAADEGQGGFLFVGGFVAGGPGGEEDEGAGEDEVAGGFGGFFVIVDELADGLG